MLRRLGKIAAVAAAVLLVAAAALIAFRATLAEAVISSRLAALGVPNARLDVSALGFEHLEIENIVLGREDELSLRTLILNYSLGGISSGRLDEISLDGLRLRLDGSDMARPFGSLQPLLAPEEGREAGGLIPETVILSAGRIELSLPEGPAVTEVSGRWNPLEDRAAMSVSRLMLPHVELEWAGMQIEATGEQVVATATVHGADGALDLDMRATIESWRDEPVLDLALEAGIRSGGWRIPPWPPEATLEGTTSFVLKGRLQPIDQTFRHPSVQKWLAGANLRGRMRASVTDAGYRGRAEGISGTLDLVASVSGGTLSLEPAGDGSIKVASLDPAWLEASGIPPAVRQLLERGLTVLLPAGEDGLSARLQPAVEGGADLALSGAAKVLAADSTLDLRADGSLALDEAYVLTRLSFPELDLRAGDIELGGYRFRQLSFAGELGGPFDNLTGSGDFAARLDATRVEDTRLGASTVELTAGFGWTGRRLELQQHGEGSASLASLRVGQAVRIAKPLSLRLGDGRLTLDAVADHVSLSHAITMHPDPATMELLRAESPPLTVKLSGGRLELAGEAGPDKPYRGDLGIVGVRLAVPEVSLAAEGVSGSVTIPMPVSGRFADIAVERLSHAQDPAYFAPFRIDSEIDRQRDALVLKATGFDTKGRARLSMHGRHRVAKGDGNLSLEMPEIAFGKAGPQPSDLFPVLAAIREASGRLAAKAEINWRREELESKGEVAISGLSFATDAATVEGLEGRILLDRLFPLSTPPGQKLSARRIDPGVPLENAAAYFDIEPAMPPRLHLTEAQAQFVDGRLTVFETVLDPARERNDVVVGVDGADLSVLLDLLKVEDVSGSGKLSGTVPIRIVDGNAIVDDGRLEGEGPGTLQVRSEAAASALAGAGEQVALMLRALEDFRYESLSVTLDMPENEQVSVMVRMLGHNPAVLDGYPFAFNINLSGNFTQLIAAVRQGARLSTDLIRPELR